MKSNGYEPLIVGKMHLNNRKKKKMQLVSLVLAALLLGIYILFSRDSVQNYRNQIFKSNTFWKDSIKMPFSDNQCLSQSTIEREDYRALEDFYEFIDVLNQRGERAINYFMCFSTLFYTAKVQSYNPYRSVYNTSDFNRLNKFYKQRNREKCVNAEYDLSKINQKQVLNWKSLEKAYR